MKTDRELLELAAKAFGITGWQSKHGYWNMKGFSGEDVVCCNNWPNFDPNTGRKLDPTFADAVLELNWNPLEDDGDALRLAVKLGLTICNEHESAGVVYCTQSFTDDLPEVRSGFAGDPAGITPQDYIATRRAIVLAAAAIGEAMQ